MVRVDIPRKVLISGGREKGGLASFAEALREGFSELGIPSVIVSPRSILSHWNDLRDPTVLKILSTSAVFAGLFAQRSICVAHGFPRPDAQGWIKTMAVLSSLKLANLARGCRLVTVSEYVAVHLRTIYGVRVDAVVHNPLQAVFCEPWESSEPRNCLTFVGRLVQVKNLDRILPAMCQLLQEDPLLRVCVIGDGPMRKELEASVRDVARIEFLGSLSPDEIRGHLRKTRVFVSGCETEALGLAYAEALSQGCAVVMPACGGGLEIAPGLIGHQIQLIPLPLKHEDVCDAIRRATPPQGERPSLRSYMPKDAATSYLALNWNRGNPAPAVKSAESALMTGNNAH